MNRVSSLSRWLAAAGLVLATGMVQAAVSVVVPGDANPWLAGMPDGTEASGGDLAPARSPVLVSGLPWVAGTAVVFQSVVGAVSYAGTCPSVFSCFGPDGDVLMTEFNYDTRSLIGLQGGENGIGNIKAPLSSLIGVFLGAEQPNLSVVAAELDFQDSAIGIGFTSLSPGLKQVFFIGDGLGAGGVLQSFIVPDGATRLYLGTMDGFGWTGNNGAFALDVSAVPEPAAWQLAFAGLALLGLRLARRRG